MVKSDFFTPSERLQIPRTCFIAFACLLLSLLFVFPWHPNSTTIPGPYIGKNAYYAKLDASIWTYLLGWGAKHPDRFYEGNILSPLPDPLVANDPRLTEGFWSIPLFRIFEPVTAWGMTLLIGLWSTAFASWYCGRKLTGTDMGGLALAVFFAFGTFRAAHVIHVEGTFIPFLPVAVVAMSVWIDRQTFFRGFIFAAALFLAMIEYSYTAVTLGLVIPPAVFFARRNWRLMIPILCAFALYAVAMLPIVVVYAEFHAATGLGRGIADVDRFSADATAWLTSPGGRTLTFGRMIETNPDAMLWPGFIMLGLGLAGARRLRAELVIVGVLGFILSFGTWRLLLWRLGIPHFDFPTPYELLYDGLLPLRGIRAPGRLAVAAHLVLALAATLAVVRLPRKIGALLLALAFIEARWNMTEIGIRPDPLPAYASIAQEPDTFAVLTRPMGTITERDGDLREAESLFGALVHGKPTPNGTIATYIPWHESIAAHQRDTAVLRALGVHTIVEGKTVTLVDSPMTPPATPAELQSRLEFLPHSHPLLREPDTRVRVIGPDAIKVEAGRLYEVPVMVINESDDTLCADGTFMGLGPRGNLRIGIRRFVDAANDRARNMQGGILQGLAVLSRDLAPGETDLVTIRGLAPNRAGEYRAHVDLLMDGMKWIYPGDSPAWFINFTVDNNP